MTINSVALSNTFNEFRTTVNDVITTLNGVSGGSGVINANTLIGGTVTANNLTSGRVALSGTAGQLTDDSAFTYNTSTDVLALGGTTDASSTTTGTLTVAGGVGIAKKLYVGTDLNVVGDSVFNGNVSFLGSNTLISTTVVNIEDNILQLSHLNPSDIVDIGFIGGYNNGANVHSGLFRDATDDTWKLFRNYTAEPSTTIDVSANGFAWANLAIGALSTANSITVATGQTYKVNNVDVLSATTLGSSVVTSSLTSVGTIGTGVWQGTIINPTYGGTGYNNGSKTIALGGNLATSGAFDTTFTATANTGVTLPTTGTLVGSADTGTVTNTMLAGSIANAKLVNSSLTVGNTNISLGATSNTLTGLVSVTSTSFVGTLTGSATSATTAGTVTTAAQPNITSVGSLTGLTVSGNMTVSGNTTHTSTGALKIPSGTTAQNAGFTTVGMIRFDTSTDALQVYKSTGWASAGSSLSSGKVFFFASKGSPSYA